MHNSRFCLHLSGNTGSSCRLFDAIASLCFPVIVSDNTDLPFEDILHYKTFALFFPQEVQLVFESTFTCRTHMYVYAYMYLHVCMYACMHVCIYACMHVCIYACMHVCIYAYMHTCIYVCECSDGLIMTQSSHAYGTFEMNDHTVRFQQSVWKGVGLSRERWSEELWFPSFEVLKGRRGSACGST